MCVLEDRFRAEAGVLTARSPDEIAEVLDPLVACDQVDPVSDLETADERQDLVRREIERMKGQAELVMKHEREKTKSAVSDPLHEDRIGIARNRRLDEGRPLTQDADAVPVCGEKRLVRLPAREKRFVYIGEEIDVTGRPGRADDRVQRGAARDVALALRDSVLRD